MVADSIISLGRSMERTVIADGVETKEQLDFLAARGCHIMQGSYYCSPIPAGDFEQLLQGEALSGEALPSDRPTTSISIAS